jgi:hypothetical protein
MDSNPRSPGYGRAQLLHAGAIRGHRPPFSSICSARQAIPWSRGGPQAHQAWSEEPHSADGIAALDKRHSPKTPTPSIPYVERMPRGIIQQHRHVPFRGYRIVDEESNGPLGLLLNTGMASKLRP